MSDNDVIDGQVAGYSDAKGEGSTSDNEFASADLSFLLLPEEKVRDTTEALSTSTHYNSKKPTWWRRLSNTRATKAQRRAMHAMDSYRFQRKPDTPYGQHLDDWSEVFGHPGRSEDKSENNKTEQSNHNQVWIELGCGKGENLLALAHLHRHENIQFLGAEVHPTALGNLFMKLQHATERQAYWTGYQLYGEQEGGTPESVRRQQHKEQVTSDDEPTTNSQNPSANIALKDDCYDSPTALNNQPPYQHKVCIFKGDGMKLLKVHVADNSVARILITFPDPFAKPAEREWRIFQPDTVCEFHRTLTPNTGLLCLATDHEGCFEWSVSVVQELSLDKGGDCMWERLDESEVMENRSEWLPAVTTYEAKGWREGRPTYLACWRKIESQQQDVSNKAESETTPTDVLTLTSEAQESRPSTTTTNKVRDEKPKLDLETQLETLLIPVLDRQASAKSDVEGNLCQSLNQLHGFLLQYHHEENEPLNGDVASSVIVRLLHSVDTQDTTKVEELLGQTVLSLSANLATVLQGLFASLQLLGQTNRGTRANDPPVASTALSNTLLLLEQLLFVDPSSSKPLFFDADKPGYWRMSVEQGFALALFNNQRNIDHSSSPSISDMMQEWVDLFLRVPRWVSNACLAQKWSLVPIRWTSSRYLTRLVQQTTLNALHEPPAFQATAGLWACLILTMIQQQGADLIVLGWWQTHRQHQDLSSWTDRISVFSHKKSLFPPSPRELSLLIRSLLCLWVSQEEKQKVDESTKEWARYLLQSLLESSREIQDATTRTCVLTLVKPSKVRVRLAELLGTLPKSDDDTEDDNDDDSDSEDGTPTSPLLHQLTKVARLWSMIHFVRQTDPELQRQASVFLEAGLNHLNIANDMLDPTIHDELVSGLLQGTSHRLESTIPTIRLDGMRVAQALAKNMGQELKFEELEQETRVEGGDGVSSGAAVDVASAGEASDNPNRTDYEPNDDDSIWDDNGLEPYSLEDDEEDLQETPRPLYLRDALNLLRTNETEESASSNHETALQALPGLIRSKPYDLPDIGMDLMIEILHHENKFDLPSYGDHKLAGLLALVVAQPQEIGMALVNEVFGSCSLLTRIHVLSTLQEGAYELSGMKQLEEHSNQKPPKGPALLDKSNRISGRRRLVAAKSEDDSNQAIAQNVEEMILESKTRRWGKGRLNQENNSVAIANTFANVAPMWFYGLLGSFLERRDDATLWGGTLGARFLSHLLFTLGTVLDYAGVSVATNTMSHDLFRLVWGFCQQAEIPEVRMAALYGVAASLSSLHDTSALLQLVENDSFDLGLTQICQSDPNPKCRELASSISLQVRQALEHQRSNSGLLL